jgi:hypothetical protein
MVGALSAALRSGEPSDIDLVLDAVPTADLKRTVAALDRALAFPLLDRLLVLFVDSFSPERHVRLLCWIEAVLLHHTPTLLATRDFGARVAPILFEAMTAQLRATERVQALGGRVRFLLSLVDGGRDDDSNDLDAADAASASASASATPAAAANDKAPKAAAKGAAIQFSFKYDE